MQQTGESETQDFEKENRALRRLITRLKSLHAGRADEFLGLKKAMDAIRQGVTLNGMNGRTRHEEY